MIIAQDGNLRNMVCKLGYIDGYDLYVANKPITACKDVLTARRWLLAQWEESCALADVWNCKPVGVHPRHHTDAAIQGIIAQAEDIAERADADNRRMGW